jgi:hypothetical protein
MQEALWENLEQVKRRREWRDRSISERKAKRAKPNDENAEPGSSRPRNYSSTSLAASSSTPVSTLPASAEDLIEPMDVDTAGHSPAPRDVFAEPPRSKEKSKGKAPEKK